MQQAPASSGNPATCKMRESTVAGARADAKAREGFIADKCHVAISRDTRFEGEYDFSTGGHDHGVFPELQNESVRAIRTGDDGACGIHAAFGSWRPHMKHWYCERARDLIGAALPDTASELCSRVRPQELRLVEAAETALWNDFVLPYVDATGRTRPARNEERSFLHLAKQNPFLRPAIVRQIGIR